MKNFLIEAVKRFKSKDVPVFFRKLQAFGVSIATLAVGIQHVPQIPTSIANGCEKAAWIGGTIVVVAQFAVTNIVDIWSNSNPNNSQP